MKKLLTVFLITAATSTFGQNNLKCILLDSKDSTVIQFAVVKLSEISRNTLTNHNGEFSFQLPDNLKELHFEISALGIRDTIMFNPKYNGIEKIYANKTQFNLKAVSVVGLSAKEIVLKAISLIPVNYTDSSFASFSFFRHYEKVNGKFKNLIEAQAVVMFKVSTSNNLFTTKNAFAIQQMRRSDFFYDIADFKYGRDGFSTLLEQEPVYNLASSSLAPVALYDYSMHFDTINKSDDYIIQYTCEAFSSDNHGIDNIAENRFLGECRESGTIVIDRNSFAFKKVERNSFRNKGFLYPKNNNWLRPSLNYYMNFIDGKLISEYTQVGGKWFLKRICREYTHEYYKAGLNSKEFTITEINEWYADSVTHFITADLIGKFYSSVDLPSCSYSYNKSKWSQLTHPFYFFNKQDIYVDIEKRGPIEQQFFSNGKQ